MTAALKAPGVALGAAGLIALRRVMLQAEAASVLANLPGGFVTRRKGHGLEVADTREYVAGDEVRHLDRNSTARTGRLHVRQFQEERDRVCLLVADFRPSMFWGLRRALRSVAAAEALALIGWSVVESGGRVGLFVLTQDAPLVIPARGRARGMLDVIGGLVDAHEKALDRVASGVVREPSLNHGLAPVARVAPSGAEIFIASGFDTPGDALPDRLAELARRRVPRLVMIGDRAAHRLPRGQYPVRLADGRRLRLALGGAAEDRSSGVMRIAGHAALVLDAGETVEVTARRLVAGHAAGGRP